MRWRLPLTASVLAASVVALLLSTIAGPAVSTSADLGPVGWAAPTSDRADGGDALVDVSVTAAATVPGPTLVAASFNVCKVDCAAPAPSWDVRRDRVARVIAETGADVIGLQEATNNPTSFAKTQAEDLANLTAPVGYATPQYSNDANECRRPRNASGQLAGPSPCDNTSMLLYRTSTVRPASVPRGEASGIVMASTIAPGIDPLSGRRSVAWAYLEGLNGTGPFLAISLHTDSAKTPEAEASRIAIGGAMATFASAWNDQHGMSGAPVILMADLNSYRKRQPRGVQQVLVDSGWLDAAAAPDKRNVQFSTINYNPLLALSEQGFPAAPYVFKTSRKKPVLDATRIDYVMALGAGLQAVDYEVVVRLNPDGTFARDFQASDHQMVRATLAFPTG